MRYNQSFSRNQIQRIKESTIAALGDIVFDIVDNIVDCGDYYSGTCPLHNSDNNNSFSIWKDSGNWVCWTKQCHVEYDNDIIGLFRGLYNCGFYEAVNKLNGLCDGKYISDNKVRERRLSQYFDEYIDGSVSQIDLKTLRLFLTPFCRAFFAIRGFDFDILKLFDVAQCLKYNSRFLGRLVFPVYDIENNVVAITGRVCYNVGGPKWMHGGSVRHTLYGIHLSHKYIRESSEVVIVEGPLGVLRLWQAGIYNCVATMGLGISDRQEKILLRLGVSTIIIGYDNDDAGNEAAKKIINGTLRNFFDLKTIRLGEFSDIDEMSPREIYGVLNA